MKNLRSVPFILVNNTVVCVSNSKVEVKRVKSRNRRKIKVLRRILKNPEMAIELGGNKKISLFLTVAYRNGFRKEKVKRVLKQKGISKIQKFLLKVLLKNDKAIKTVVKEDLSLLLLLKDKIEIDHKVISNLENKYGGLQVTLDQWSNKNFKEELSNSKEIIQENILNRKIKGSLVPESHFYPENSLYNELLLAADEPEVFNKDLLNQTYITFHERAVRDFVSGFLEEEDMKAYLK